MSKFQVKLNSGAPGLKASVGAGATVTATIDNTAGFSSFSWSIAGTDETTDWEATAASIVTSGARNETATVTAGSIGSAIRLMAVADGGINQRTGAADPTLIATAKIFVPAANGAEVITINETRESDATWAYLALVNNAIRATYGGGPALSDEDPKPLGEADPGVAGTAMRGDAVIPHGDLPGGSLHEVAVASVAGAGGSAGFASPAMAEKLAGIPAWSTAATPDTLAQRTADGSLAMVNATCSGAATVTGVCTAGSLVSASLTHASSDITVSAPASGKVTIINGGNGVVIRKGGLNVCIIGDTVSPSVSQWFQMGFDPVISQYAAVSGTGRSLTIQGQNVTTGVGGHLLLKAGIGSTKAGEVQLSGDVIRGLSNEWAWMTLDTFTRATFNSANGIVLTGKGIKLQVNDSITPATVRTPLEIVREKSGPGTHDSIDISSDISVYDTSNFSNTFTVSRSGSVFQLEYTNDDSGAYAKWSDIVFLFTGAPTLVDTLVAASSTATAGQIRLVDGEGINFKGSTGAEVCGVSFDKTLNSAVFGSDGAGTRPATTAVLAGSTSAQLAVSGTAKLEARVDQVKANTQIANGVNAVSASTATTTIDCSKGNVHKVTVTAATTIELTNTKAGAQYRIYFELSGSTSYTVTLGTASFDGTYTPSATAPGVLDTYPLTSSLAHGGLICEPFADGGKAFVTRQWTTP